MNTIKCSQEGTGMLERPLVNLVSSFVFDMGLTKFWSELVLKRPGGSFYPAYWLMSTLCHEVYGPIIPCFPTEAYTLSNASWHTSR